MSQYGHFTMTSGSYSLRGKMTGKCLFAKISHPTHIGVANLGLIQTLFSVLLNFWSPPFLSAARFENISKRKKLTFYFSSPIEDRGVSDYLQMQLSKVLTLCSSNLFPMMNLRLCLCIVSTEGQGRVQYSPWQNAVKKGSRKGKIFQNFGRS